MMTTQGSRRSASSITTLLFLRGFTYSSITISISGLTNSLHELQSSAFRRLTKFSYRRPKPVSWHPSIRFHQFFRDCGKLNSPWTYYYPWEFDRLKSQSTSPRSFLKPTKGNNVWRLLGRYHKRLRCSRSLFNKRYCLIHTLLRLNSIGLSNSQPCMNLSIALSSLTRR